MSCYICSREEHAVFVRELGKLVCNRPECLQQARRMPPWHCQWRDSTGRLCGEVAGVVLGRHRGARCEAHLKAEFGANWELNAG